MSSEKHITHSAGRIAAGTTLSRVLGYFRDMLVAHAFGAGFFADAFYAAYRIPNLMRRLLGEGSLSASFIPVLSRYSLTKSKEETQELLNVVFTALAVVLSVLTVLGIVFSPQLVHLIAYGFTADPEKLALTVDLTRLMFPFLLFICLAALLLGILNTFNAFFVPAVAPATLSVSEIGFILAVAPLLSPGNQIRGLALSVILGGFLHFIVQLPRLYSLGWKLQWKLKLDHPGLRQIGLLMLPSMIGLSVDQINAFVGTMLASFLAQGSITALYYSNRLMQLPLAIFGLALSGAALPAMSKAAAGKDIGAVKDTLNYSIRLIIFILVPSAVGLMVIGLPIVRLLFERGNFTPHASAMTGSALFFFSLGLPAYAVARVLANTFYSFHETAMPVKVAAAAMVMNIALSVMLMRPLGVGGLALATAVSSYFNAVALSLILRRRIGALGASKILWMSLKTLLAASLMGAASYWIAFKSLASLPAVGTVVALAAGILIYFCLSVLLRIEERKPLFSLIVKDRTAVKA
ncbi:MAG: murein biosynthesis integral membrane protein MurJ [Endomicrobiales bacterium]